MQEGDDCDVCIVAGHEDAHGMRTPFEQEQMIKAWFSDVPDEHHKLRLQEEHAFLTRKKDAFLQKIPPKAEFKAKSTPVGIDDTHAYAIEFIDDAGAQAYQAHFEKMERDELLYYFRECMSRAKSQQQLKYVGIDLNTLLQVDDSLREHLIPLLTEMKELYKTLPDDPELLIEDVRFDALKRTEKERPFHSVTLSKLPPQKNLCEEMGDDYGFFLMLCPLPLLQTKQRVDTKRCQWKRSGPIYSYNKDTVPIVRHMHNHVLVVRSHGSSIYVTLIKTDKSETVLSYRVPINEPVVDCYWDDKTNYVGLLFKQYIMLVADTQKVTLINVGYEENARELTAIFLGYNELVVGTTGGEVLIFKQYTLDMEDRPLVYHSLPSSAPIHYIKRSACNLYATNVMNVVNVETADANNFARGYQLQTNGQIFAADRIIGMDSCGALMASLNKYGTLQIQPNRFCPDPDNPNKRLDSAVFSMPSIVKDGVKPLTGLFYQYQAVYLGRRRLCCLYPDGRIQCIWYIESEA